MLTHSQSIVCAISDNFRIWSRISLERIKQSTSKNRVINYNPSHIRQNDLVNFGPPTKKL